MPSNQKPKQLGYRYTHQQLQITIKVSPFQDLVVLGHKRVAGLEIFQSFLALLLDFGSFQLPLLVDFGQKLHLLPQTIFMSSQLFGQLWCPVLRLLPFSFQNFKLCDSSLTPNLDISAFFVRIILKLGQWVFLVFLLVSPCCPCCPCCPYCPCLHPTTAQKLHHSLK